MAATGLIQRLKSKLSYDSEEDIDSPETTIKRRELIKSKPFLKNIYLKWYEDLIKGFKSVPEGTIVEIGSGGGFLKDIFPSVTTSDILPLPFVDEVFSAEKFPYQDGTLSGICMVNVLHHIPDSASFFKEAERVLCKGGKIIMVEPANTIWSRFIYSRFHHEPFEVDAGWSLPASGPLSGANGALPWIILVRDRKKFQEKYPGLSIERVKGHTGMTYLISGGVSMRSLVPDWSYGFFYALESILGAVLSPFAMFMTVEVKKI